MFYEPKTLIIVYKDEMLANQMKKLIETKDDTDGSITGTRDNSINVVTWTEKVWLANKKAGNITSKVLFLGNIKGVDALIPVLDIKFERHGVRYGWAGNQAVIYVKPSEIKSIESYYAFHTELESLPAPQIVKDAVKPKSSPIKSEASEVETLSTNEAKGFVAKSSGLLKKARESIGDAVTDLREKAFVSLRKISKTRKQWSGRCCFSE